MKENTREINHKSMQFNFENLKPDAYAVYDQCFEEKDFDPRFTYIAHADRRMGWVPSRNGLLKWFYESDYDYAFWIDANSTISSTCLNDVLSIFDALRNDKLPQVDTVFGTLGMWVSQERIVLKQSEDYFETVHLVPARNDRSYNWMHGLIIKNYKKYYNQEFYIDNRCDVMDGTAEDVFFTRMIRRLTNSYVAPTVVCNKPDSSKSCTMDNGKGTYEYPPIRYDAVETYISETVNKNKHRHVNLSAGCSEIILPRVEGHKDKLKPFKSRKKVKEENSNITKIDLF